jgi:hypothetical protein
MPTMLASLTPCLGQRLATETSVPRPTRILTLTASISMPPASGLALRRAVFRSLPDTACTVAPAGIASGGNWGACRRQVNTYCGVARVAGQCQKRPGLVPTSPRQSGPCRTWRTNDGIPSPQSFQRDRETRLSHVPRDGGSGTTLTLQPAMTVCVLNLDTEILYRRKSLHNFGRRAIHGSTHLLAAIGSSSLAEFGGRP